MSNAPRSDESLAAANRSSARRTSSNRKPNNVAMLTVSWLSVGVPLAWGVAQTLKKALALFT